MAIIAAVYAVLVWLIFFKLKWLRWGWLTERVTVLVGLLVCAIFQYLRLASALREGAYALSVITLSRTADMRICCKCRNRQAMRPKEAWI
jgi:hypothetical protein